MNGYVYHKQLVSPEDLETLIDNLSNQSYYFLRYSHAVSGICASLPSERGEIEGQMFNVTCELRWKKYKSGYEVLILSQQEHTYEGFQAVAGKWEIYEHNAYWYDPNETKFPKGFIFKGVKSDPIKQRYFKDSTTATVHFVALTINEHDSNSTTSTTKTSTTSASNGR